MAGLIHPKTEQLTSTIRAAFANLPENSREALAKALTALRSHALILAEHQWRNHKAPLAAYWKAVGVYCGHFARALRKSPPNPPATHTDDMAGYLKGLSKTDLLHHTIHLYNDNERLRKEIDTLTGTIR